MKRFLLLLLLLPVLSARAEIYKWVDEQGHTHFGETIPEKYRKSSTTVTPKPINTVHGMQRKGLPPPPAPAITSPSAPATPAAAKTP